MYRIVHSTTGKKVCAYRAVRASTSSPCPAVLNPNSLSICRNSSTSSAAIASVTNLLTSLIPGFSAAEIRRPVRTRRMASASRLLYGRCPAQKLRYVLEEARQKTCGVGTKALCHLESISQDRAGPGNLGPGAGNFADLPRRLSATRRPRLLARSGRQRPGRRRAGQFVQLREER